MQYRHVIYSEKIHEVFTPDRQPYGFGPFFGSGFFPGGSPAQEQTAAAVEEAAPQVPEEVLVLLNDTRPLTELSVEELGARAKQARNFSKMKGLPPETRDQLQAIAQAARGEIAAREQQAAQPAAPAAEQLLQLRSNR